MSIRDFFSTSDMNPRTMLLGVLALWLALFSLFSWLSGEAQREAVSAKSRYSRVSVLVEKVQDRQMAMGDLAGQQPVAAMRTVSASLKLENALVSVREEDVAGRSGVSLFYESLDGRQLVELLAAAAQRTGLVVTECTINHRLDDPKRADMQLTLAR